MGFRSGDTYRMSEQHNNLFLCGGGGGDDLEAGPSGSSDVLHTHSLSHLHQQQTSLLTHLKHTLYTHRDRAELAMHTISHCTMFMNVCSSKVCL